MSKILEKKDKKKKQTLSHDKFSFQEESFGGALHAMDLVFAEESFTALVWVPNRQIWILRVPNRQIWIDL